MKKKAAKTITIQTEIGVRFSEVDSLGIVWHGNYIKYFEDGREAFGFTHDLKYLDIFAKGFVTPIVRTVCDYKSPLKYGERAMVETSYVDTAAAKLKFEYKIFRLPDQKLVATGETVQVFLNAAGELQLTIPDFFEEWKKKWDLK